MGPWQAAWAGAGAVLDLLRDVATAQGALSAADWAEATWAARPQGDPLTWGDIESWQSSGIVAGVASTPEEARAAWLARACYSAGLVHGPLAQLGWMQSTPAARALWSQLTAGTAAAREVQRDAWRAAHPALAAQADATAAVLAPAATPGSGIAAGTWGAPSWADDLAEIGRDATRWLTERVDLDTLAWILPVAALALRGSSMATKRKRRTRRTTTKRRTTRRRASRPAVSMMDAGVGVAAGLAAGLAAGYTGVMTMPAEKEADALKAVPATGALVGAGAGLALAILGGSGTGSSGAVPAIARGAGDGLAGYAGALMAVGPRGRAAIAGARLAQSSDAGERARGVALLQAVQTPPAASTTGAAARVSPEARRRMLSAAATRLGMADATGALVSGPAALTGALVSGPAALTGALVSGPGALTADLDMPRSGRYT